jgi:hypothetical protein
MVRRRDLPYRSRGRCRPTRRSERRSPRRRRKRSKRRDRRGGMRARQRRPGRGCTRSRRPPAGDTRLCIAARPLAPLPVSARSRVQLFVARDARSYPGARRTPTTHLKQVSKQASFLRRFSSLLGWARGIPHLKPKIPQRILACRVSRSIACTTVIRTPQRRCPLQHISTCPQRSLLDLFPRGFEAV